MSNVFYIHKRNGGFTNTQSLKDYWAAAEDGTYQVEIKRKQKRTLSQNAWLHAILPIVKTALYEAGYTDVKTNDDAKMVLKALFFKKKISNGIEEIEIIESTSAQDKMDFAAKADEIITWAKEYLGIDIAPPGAPLVMFD